MNDLLKTTIQTLLAKIDINTTPEAALKFTQAALNLAHVAGTLAVIPPQPK